MSKPRIRILSLLLTVAMVFTMIPMTGFAAEGDCTHSHGEGCSYVEGVDCDHTHDADCEWDEETQTGCTHEHDADCGYIAAIPCDHQHDETCGGLPLGDSGSPAALTDSMAFTTQSEGVTSIELTDSGDLNMKIETHGAYMIKISWDPVPEQHTLWVGLKRQGINSRLTFDSVIKEGQSSAYFGWEHGVVPGSDTYVMSIRLATDDNSSLYENDDMHCLATPEAGLIEGVPELTYTELRKSNKQLWVWCIPPKNAQEIYLVKRVKDSGGSFRGNQSYRAQPWALIDVVPGNTYECMIIATAPGYPLAKSEVFEVEVPIPPDSPYISADTIEGVPVSQLVNIPLTLPARALPENANSRDIVWTLSEDSPLQDVTIEDGVLTAPSLGTAIITATVENGIAADEDYVENFILEIVNTQWPPSFLTKWLPQAVYNQTYAGPLSPDGQRPLKVEVLEGMPPGLALDEDFVIRGVPTEKGDFNIKLRLTDGNYKVLEQTFPVTVGSPSGVVPISSISGSKIVAGEDPEPIENRFLTLVRGEFYEYKFSVNEDATGPVYWKLNSGANSAYGLTLYQDGTLKGIADSESSSGTSIIQSGIIAYDEYGYSQEFGIAFTFDSGTQTKTLQQLHFPANQAQVALGETDRVIAAQNSASSGLAIAYTSSDSAVAEVDPATGQITPKTLGYTTVTASVDGDGSHHPGQADYVLQIVGNPITVDAGTLVMSKHQDSTSNPGTIYGEISYSGVLPGDEGKVQVDYVATNGYGYQTGWPGYYSVVLDLSLSGESADKYTLVNTQIAIPGYIYAYQMSNAVISPIDDQAHTGEPVCPLPVVKLYDEVLSLNQDYQLSYTNNVDIGTAQVHVTGIGKCTGTISANFNITGTSATPVAWSGLTANGAANTTDTTALTLTFETAPATLAATDITVTGATKGALSGTGTTRTLAISDITVAEGENVTVTIANPSGYTITPSSKTVAVHRVSAPATPVITTPTGSLNGGTVGTAYTTTIVASNSPTSFAVSVGSLPNGLSINNSGVISGTPTAAETSIFSITATNATGTSAAVQYSITVEAAVDSNATVDGFRYTYNPAASVKTATLIGYEGADALTGIDISTVIIDGVTYDVTAVGPTAFNGCTTLTSVSLPNVITLGDSAFLGCSALTSVNLPNATSIGDSAFYQCRALTSISLTAATTIGNQAFEYCSVLESAYLPAATSIGNRAFRECTALTSVSLPEATAIGDNAFDSCTSLESVYLPKAETIGEYAFFSCRALTKADLPVATSIGQRGFGGCSMLESANLPAATFLGDSAFSTCNNLGLVLGATPPDLGGAATSVFSGQPVICYPDTAETRAAWAAFMAAYPVPLYSPLKDTYTVSYEISPTGAGTVDGAGSYSRGDRVTLSAAPSGDMRFVGWSDSGWNGRYGYIHHISYENAHSLAAFRDVTLTACFAAFQVNCNAELYNTRGELGPLLALGEWFAVRPDADTDTRTFDHWEMEPVGAIKFDTEVVDGIHYGYLQVESDVTLTAVFKNVGADTFALTVQNGTGSGNFEAGTVVTITANDPPAGQRFKEWQVVSGGVTLNNAQAQSTSFTMPANAVTVTATYEALPVDTYSITVQNDGNGTANANVNSAQLGASITLTATPNSGYQFKEWQVISGGVTIAGNSFTMPAANVTVKAIFEPISTYTITFNPNGGSVSPTTMQTGADGKLASLPTPTRSGSYSFNGWYTAISGGTRITTSYVFTAHATVFARWTSDSSSDNGSTGGGTSSGGSNAWTTTVTSDTDMPVTATVNIPGTVDANRNLTANVTEAMVRDAITKAQAEATRLGKTADGIIVEINITATGGNSLNIKLDDSALSRLNAAGAGVSVNSDIFRFTLDAAAVKQVNTQSSGGVTFTAVPTDKLSSAAQAAIGSRPVYDFNLVDSTGKAITSYGSGTITRGINYTAASGERTGNLFAVKVLDNGSVEWITESSYTNGWLIWTGSSNSVYGVGYKTPAPAFTDTTTHWAKDNIDFVASRGLFNGTSATTFSPDTSITRGMFVTALGRLSEQDVSVYTASSFTDVAAGSYYLSYIEWAVEHKIVQGIGNNQFAPDKAITHEEMAVMIYNYAKATNYTLPASRETVAFTDNAQISSWAKDAIKALQQAGVVAGVGDGKFNPAGTATRAEAATILRNFVEGIIDEATARGWAKNEAGQWMYWTWDGKLRTGWINTTAGSRYYMDENGIMVAGKWVQIGGKWYYMQADGKLATNTTIDGYEVGVDGARKE